MPALMRNFFDVDFFPMFIADRNREIGERGIRFGGGTKPLGQERSYERGAPAEFARDGVLRGSDI